MTRHTLSLLPILLLAAACRTPPRPLPNAAGPIDARATPETRALFTNMRRMAGRQIMFGHQDDLAYGFGWTAEPGRSDVKESAGAYPAVYGWDASRLERGDSLDIDGVSFARQRAWIADGYRRGGVITMSWHMDNPLTGRDAWDTTSAIAAVLPGGAKHEQYLRWLDAFARHVSTLRGTGRSGTETLVPVIFRPFHEMSGGWFWWGTGHATAEQYVALWRMTVAYLRDTKQVHNVLYAYSTDKFDSPADYLARYPGDAWVDVLGFDDYQSVKSPAMRDVLVRRLRDVATLAAAKGKIAALTETGVEGMPDSLWFTGTLLPALDADSLTRRTSYVMAWRNAHQDAAHPSHFFTARPGHPSAADIARFRASPLIAFEDELPDMYRLP